MKVAKYRETTRRRRKQKQHYLKVLFSKKEFDELFFFLQNSAWVLPCAWPFSSSAHGLASKIKSGWKERKRQQQKKMKTLKHRSWNVVVSGLMLINGGLMMIIDKWLREERWRWCGCCGQERKEATKKKGQSYLFWVKKKFPSEFNIWYFFWSGINSTKKL